MTTTSLISGLLSSLSVTSATFYLVIAAVAVIIYYKYRNSSSNNNGWSQYGVKSHNIPGLHLFENDLRNKITELFQQYGDTFGVQDGSRLNLFTADINLWKHILIKDFSNFVNREVPISSSSPFFKSLFFAPGSEWRRHRQILSPTFTTGKLKHIAKPIVQSAEDLTNYLKKCAVNGTPVPIKDVCGQFTGEIIAKTAFGLDAKFIGEDQIEFYEYSKNMIHLVYRTGIYATIAHLLQQIPYLRKLSVTLFKLQYYDPIDLKANKYFDVILKNTIEERRQQQKNGVERPYSDFLDLALKASEAAEAGKLEAAEELFQNEAAVGVSKPMKGITDQELLGHSMLVIFAGMETTASTLQMCLYELAANPDVQEKVFQEITNVIKGTSPTSEELASLIYTEQVINETLRLYPSAPIVNRIAKETKTYNGITIPKGATVTIPYFYILKDSRVFPDPEKFDPNRFSPEEKEKRDPITFCPFGHGPRICLGMRLAYLELKQGLAHVIRQLKVVLNENTEPKQGSFVKMTGRRLVTTVTPVTLVFQLR